MEVEVIVKYLGKYAEKTGTREEKLCLDADISIAHDRLLKYLDSQYGIIPPFNIMVGGNHIIGAKKRGLDLEKGDEIQVLPFFSGG